MVASTNRNALVIKNSSQVVRVNVIKHERLHTGFIFRGSNETNAFDPSSGVEPVGP